MKIRQHAIRILCSLGLWVGLGCQAQAQTRTVHLYYTDPQGTVLAKTDAQGNIIAQYDYTPYGNTVASLGSPPDGPGYTGHVNDPETGLVYMQARYYSPVGRFLSPDPVGPVPGNVYSFNRYDYANDNPQRYTDPDGRCVDGLTCGLPQPTTSPEPTTPTQPTTSPKPAAPEARKSSATLRRIWEKMTGKEWPKDPATGRNQDVAHKDAVGDGGSPNDPNNYEPKPHDQHMQEHKDNGDFKRWGARSAGGRSSSGGRSTAPETPPAASEAPAPIEPPPMVEPPIIEPPIIEPILIP